MKFKTLAAALAILQAGAVSGIPGKTTHQYALTVCVAEINWTEDFVVYETHNGHRFEWGGVEDQETGEIYALMMDDNGTPETIEDDVIISARYSGWSINDVR